MGDSFSLERHPCANKNCDAYVLFFVDAESVRDGERARSTCERCGRVNILRSNGARELAPRA